MIQRFVLAASVAATFAWPFVVPAQSRAATPAAAYPDRPVRIIVPFPPGGSNDIVGRFMAARMSDRMGQQFVADNRPGADGIIGSDIAARALPDGHTLLVMSTSYVMNPAIHKMPFDPVKALVPVATIGTGPNAIVAFPGFPAANLKDLIAATRAKPGQINYASSGIGGFNHFSGELFKTITGVDLTHVPYKGGGPALIDVMAGQVPVSFSTLIGALPHLRSGRLKALATGGARRAPALADVPTAIEQGVAGYEVTIWWAFFAPAATPRPIVNKLNAEVGKILAEPETAKRLSAEAAEPYITQPDEFARVIVSDLARWARVAKQANIRSH